MYVVGPPAGRPRDGMDAVRGHAVRCKAASCDGRVARSPASPIVIRPSACALGITTEDGGLEVNAGDLEEVASARTSNIHADVSFTLISQILSICKRSVRRPLQQCPQQDGMSWSWCRGPS